MTGYPPRVHGRWPGSVQKSHLWCRLIHTLGSTYCVKCQLWGCSPAGATETPLGVLPPAASLAGLPVFTSSVSGNTHSSTIYISSCKPNLPGHLSSAPSSQAAWARGGGTLFSPPTYKCQASTKDQVTAIRGYERTANR